MPKKLPVNAEFEGHIESYDEAVVDLARRTRAFVLSRAPGSKELTYNNHVPAVAFTPTGALKHAFCHVAVYTKHVNLGFNRGAELDDPELLVYRSNLLGILTHSLSPPKLTLLFSILNFAKSAVTSHPTLNGKSP